MNKRSFAGEQVSALGIGTGRLASLGSGHSPRDAERLIYAAAELGINLIDTADTYGSTQCEQLLGKILHDGSKEFLISTKAGFPFAEFPKPLSLLNQFGKKALQKMGKSQNFSAPYISKCIDGSLRRLRRDTLDFFFLHSPLLPVWQDDSLLRVLQNAKDSGKIRHLGVSSDSPTLLANASQNSIFEVFQTQVNPKIPHLNSISSLCRSENLTRVVANHVLGGHSFSSPLSQVNEIARELSASPHAILLAFAAAQPGVATVLTGTGNADHLRANAAALSLTLSPSQLARISCPADLP